MVAGPNIVTSTNTSTGSTSNDRILINTSATNPIVQKKHGKTLLVEETHILRINLTNQALIRKISSNPIQKVLITIPIISVQRPFSIRLPHQASLSVLYVRDITRL
ncbi:hypothetical protein FRC18_003570 [Serendipita sp. 400]|nr:hypothetical protein FRC18_003570 [Serendipita sp. 400]